MCIMVKDGSHGPHGKRNEGHETNLESHGKRWGSRGKIKESHETNLERCDKRSESHYKRNESHVMSHDKNL